MDAQAEQVLSRIRIRSHAQYALETPRVGNYRGPVLFTDSRESRGTLIGEIHGYVVLDEFKFGVVLEKLQQWLLLGLRNQIADNDPAGERNGGISTGHSCVDNPREYLGRCSCPCRINARWRSGPVNQIDPILQAELGEVG